MKCTKTILLTAFLLLVFLASSAQAATIDVGPGYTYSTIAAGMAAAKSGDSVHVHAGTYTLTSSVMLKSGVTVYGDGYSSTVVQATDKANFASESSPAFFYGSSVSNVEIYGFKFKGPASSKADIHDSGQTYYGGHDEYHTAIKLTSCTNARVHDCYATLLLSDFVRTSGCSYLYIYHNVIDTSGHDGAQMYNSRNTYFYNNYVSIMINCGVRASGGSNHTISQNTFTNGYSGSGWTCVQLQGGVSGVTVTKNVFTRTSDNYCVSGYSYSGAGSTVSNNVGYQCPSSFLNSLGSASNYNNTIYSTEYDWAAWGYGYNAASTSGGGSSALPDSSSPYSGSPAVALSSPANATTVTPSNGKVSLSWTSVGSTNYGYFVATDSGFSSIVTSGTTTNNAVKLSLNNSTTYFWRVRAYTDSTSSWGANTTSRSFTTTNSTTGNSGVYGVVTDPDSGTPVQGATVTLSNSTWSGSTTTDASGYYQFDVPANSGTYYTSISAPDYTSSGYQTPNSVEEEYSEQSVTLTKAQTYFSPNYVKFVVTNQYITAHYSGATINIYVEDESDVVKTLTTGSDGAAGCELTEDVRYRLETTLNGVTQTDYIMPLDNEYFIIFDTTPASLVPAQFYENISIAVTKDELNTSTASINISYVDEARRTENVQFVLGQTDKNGTFTTLDTSPLFNSSRVNTSFLVTNYISENYVVKVNVVHQDFGTVTKMFAVIFGGNTSPLANYKELGYLGIFLLFIVAAQFGRQEHASGAIILCAMAWFMIGIGLFKSLGAMSDLIEAGTFAATIYAIMAYMNSTKEGGM